MYMLLEPAKGVVVASLQTADGQLYLVEQGLRGHYGPFGFRPRSGPRRAVAPKLRLSDPLHQRLATSPKHQESILYESLGLAERPLEATLLGSVDGRLDGEESFVDRVR